MSARNGLVSTLVDPQPDKLAVVNQQWVSHLAAYLPGGIIRAPLASGADNSFPTALYRHAIAMHRAAGLDVIGVLAQEFCLGALNNPLGPDAAHQHYDLTLNAAIDAYTLRAMAVCRQLVPAGLAGVFVWNEPNISDQPAIGVYPPHVKPTALNPKVAGSLLYQGARRLKLGAQVPVIYAPALTCLEQAHTNPTSDWVGGYLDEMYAYVRSCGHRDYLWDYVGVNMEGHVDAAYALKVATTIRAVAAKYGHAVKVYVGEWSWQNGAALDLAAARATYEALRAAFDQLFFFAYHLTQPRNFAGYGCVDWSEANGQIGPSGLTAPWYDTYRGLIAG